MAEPHPILVTGAGSAGSIGRRVAERLSAQRMLVRALVHHDDDRAKALRSTEGVEVAAVRL